MDCVRMFCLCVLHVVCIHTCVCACVGMYFLVHRHKILVSLLFTIMVNKLIYHLKTRGQQQREIAYEI